MKNTIIALIALPGTGKLTVAKEIIKKTDIMLIDNHSINNIIFPMVNPDGFTKLPDNIWIYIRQIRVSVLDAMVDIALPDKNFIFTNALLDDKENDYKVYEQLLEVAKKRKAKFVPVRLLLSDVEEYKKRISSPDRKEKLKEINPEAANRYKGKELIKITHPNLLDIETSNTTPAELAEIILNHAEKA